MGTAAEKYPCGRKEKETGRIRSSRSKRKLGNSQGESSTGKGQEKNRLKGRRGREHCYKLNERANCKDTYRNYMKCFYTNADCLLKKRLELSTLIELNSPDIICVT